MPAKQMRPYEGAAVKLLSFPELKTKKGIPFCRQYVHRLVKAGKFPAPVKVGEATNGWVESELDSWLAIKVAARDATRRAA